MKKKILISCLVILIMGLIITYYLKKNSDEKNETIDKNTVSDIDTAVDNDNTKTVDFSNFKTFSIDLTENLKITKGGIYNLTGKIDNGQIYIDTNESVKLILNNVDITNKSGPAIMVENANIVYIELADNSVNKLIDSKTYDNSSYDETNGVILSKDDLVFLGNGKLVIHANYEDGIVAKDNLKIIDGNYEIDAVHDAIRGKDSIVILDGNFTINAGSDALKSTNSTDSSLGYILIENGNFEIITNNDGIQSESDLVIHNGDFDITTGSGSDNVNNNLFLENDPFSKSNMNNTDEESHKGIKAVRNIMIKNGSFRINSLDDSIHSNEYVGIEDGTFLIESGDDGIHADNEIIIDNGTFEIIKSYEGIEAESITINGCNINIISSDDGINVAGGSDSSSINGRPGMNNFAGTGNSKITINGGNIYISSNGDGIDANGSIFVNGGIIIVNGPTDNGNGAIDYDQEFKITGGTLIASGSSGMAQGVSNNSTQMSIMINYQTIIKIDTVISVFDSSGSEIITYKASKDYQNLIISSSKFKDNTEYTIYIDGSSTSKEINGLYAIGGYQGGSKYTTFTTNGTVTIVGTIGSMNPGMKPNMQGESPNIYGPNSHR